MYTQYTSDTNHPKHFQNTEGKNVLGTLINTKNICILSKEKDKLKKFIIGKTKTINSIKYYKYIYLGNKEISIFVDGKKRFINSIYFEKKGNKYTFSIFLRDVGQNNNKKTYNDYVRIADLKTFVVNNDTKTMFDQIWNDIQAIKLKKYEVTFKTDDKQIICKSYFTIVDNDKWKQCLTGEIKKNICVEQFNGNNFLYFAWVLKNGCSILYNTVDVHGGKKTEFMQMQKNDDTVKFQYNHLRAAIVEFENEHNRQNFIDAINTLIDNKKLLPLISITKSDGTKEFPVTIPNYTKRPTY